MLASFRKKQVFRRVLLSNVASCGHPSLCMSGPSWLRAQPSIDPTAPSTGAVVLLIISQSFPIHAYRHQDHLPWHGSQRCLVQEARCIVAIEERRGIEHATRQILQIDAGEAVGGSCVPSNPKDTRVGSVADLEVCDYLDDVVLRSRRATVPI